MEKKSQERKRKRTIVFIFLKLPPTGFAGSTGNNKYKKTMDVPSCFRAPFQLLVSAGFFTTIRAFALAQQRGQLLIPQALELGGEGGKRAVALGSRALGGGGVGAGVGVGGGGEAVGGAVGAVVSKGGGAFGFFFVLKEPKGSKPQKKGSFLGEKQTHKTQIGGMRHGRKSES